MRSVRRTVLTLCAAAGLSAGLVAFPNVASAEPAPTSISTVKGPANATGYPTLTNVRWAAHDTFDRIVFDFTGGTPGYRVGYGTLEGLGSGDAITLAGNADLIVDFDFARAHDDNYNPTYAMETRNPVLKTLRQVKWGGDYEGYVRAGLGLREMVGFRVTTLTGPPRVVVDMAHRSAFSTAGVRLPGTAGTVVVDGIRGARQTGYDRVVWDVRGTAKPTVSVRYVPDSTTIQVGLIAGGSAPKASYGGPTPITYNFPAVRTVRLAASGAGVLTFRVTTAAKRGFRVTVLTSPVRVVLDVAR